MSIRAKLNENPGIAIVVTIVGVILAVGVVSWISFAESSGDGLPRYYFTTDDTVSGDAALNSLFAGEASNIPPFLHGGRMAVRAHVFTCDGGKTRFITYLERYNEAAQKKISDAQAKLKPGDLMLLALLDSQQNNVEVKKPGPGPWVKITNESVSHPIMAVTCPDGSNKNLEPVDP